MIPTTRELPTGTKGDDAGKKHDKTVVRNMTTANVMIILLIVIFIYAKLQKTNKSA